jgi:hypothetical protein
VCRIKVVRRDPRFRMICQPRFDYGRSPHGTEETDGGKVIGISMRRLRDGLLQEHGQLLAKLASTLDLPGAVAPANPLWYRRISRNEIGLQPRSHARRVGGGLARVPVP